MTGAEHYRQAEEYLEAARGSLNAEYDGYVSRAQVHATLALAAATALSGNGHGMPVRDYNAWHDTVGTQDGAR
jgi:hypothetical protein